MAASIRQFVDTANSIKTAINGLSVNFSNTTLTGSTILLISAFSNDVGDISGITCTDPVGNTYTRIVDVADTSSAGDERFQMWYCLSALPLTSSQAITINNTYTDYTEILAIEITGLTGYLGANGTWQTGINGGTSNNLTTGNIAGGTGTTFFVGGSMNSLEGGSLPFYPSVGTGLTQGGLWFIDPLDSGATGNNAALATWGYGTFSNPGTTSYHFTAPSTASNTNFVTFGALFSTSSAPATLTITSTSPLTAGTVGAAYSYNMGASGGTTPYVWSISSGTLPAGLALSSSGNIAGTPTTVGTSSPTIKVTDASGNTASGAFSITISAAPVPLNITTTSPLPSGRVGVAYTDTFAVTGGTSPYTWSIISGAFPAGLSFSSTGVLSGTPSASGSFTATVKVADSASASTSSSFSITIAPAVSISTTSLPAASCSTQYSTTLTATGGVSPYTWSVSSGVFPTGYSLVASTGVISGISNTPSTTTLGFTVTDSIGGTSTHSFTFLVQYLPSQGNAVVWWLV